MPNNDEKNRWLVENMLGECWHDIQPLSESEFLECKNLCKGNWHHQNILPTNPDFFTSDPDLQAINFFKLWRAIQGKEWFKDGILIISDPYGTSLTEAWYFIPISLIFCPTLADALGDYFDWKPIKEGE